MQTKRGPASDYQSILQETLDLNFLENTQVIFG